MPGLGSHREESGASVGGCSSRPEDQAEREPPQHAHPTEYAFVPLKDSMVNAVVRDMRSKLRSLEGIVKELQLPSPEIERRLVHLGRSARCCKQADENAYVVLDTRIKSRQGLQAAHTVVVQDRISSNHENIEREMGRLQGRHALQWTLSGLVVMALTFACWAVYQVLDMHKEVDILREQTSGRTRT